MPRVWSPENVTQGKFQLPTENGHVPVQNEASAFLYISQISPYLMGNMVNLRGIGGIGVRRGTKFCGRGCGPCIQRRTIGRDRSSFETHDIDNMRAKNGSAEAYWTGRHWNDGPKRFRAKGVWPRAQRRVRAPRVPFDTNTSNPYAKETVIWGRGAWKTGQRRPPESLGTS